MQTVSASWNESTETRFLLKVLLLLIECCVFFASFNTTNITQVQARARVITKKNGYIRVVEWSWSS